MTQLVASRGPRAGQLFLGCTRFPACKGTLSVDGTEPAQRRRGKTSKSTRARGTNSGKRSPLLKGDLMVCSENSLGVGKAVDRRGDIVVLEYFDNPAQPAADRFHAEVHVRSLRRFRLDQEVRVFWSTDLGWLSGRLEPSNEHRDISVKTRDGGHKLLRERDVYIRWDRPLYDPVGFGGAGMMESPLLSDLRRPFMHHVLRQRSASHGMGSAISASIQLHPHQLDAARRVLEDPIQRYLLADEVGLGKTIEAGIVIRQIMEDDCAATVQLILPPFLVAQWRRELETKFNVLDFQRDRIRISRDDRPDTWKPADLLVVDEAHNLASLRTSASPDLQARFTKLTEVALASPRLLLLSATPILHNEEVFLGMLRLLDPSLYGRATVNDVRKKVASRADLGRTLLGLKPSLPASVITRRLDEVRSLLVDDPQVQVMAQSVQEAVGTKDKTIVAEAIVRLHGHVSEVHRVHRRMIRTRRTDGLRAGYRVQGRTKPTRWALDAAVLDTASNLLDEWREYAVESTEIGSLKLQDAGRLFSEACSLLLDHKALSGWARRRRDNASSDDEVEVLERMEYVLDKVDRRATVSAPLADHLSYEIATGERVLVFCPTPSLAEELAAEIGELLGEQIVALHLQTSDPDDAEASIRAFESDGDVARILVCDRSAEEGRNFQMADLVVHVGLPSSVNQLEQRIGRTDRWTGSTEVEPPRGLHVVSGDRHDNWDLAWTAIVERGFEVFTASVASLQHAVERSTDEAWAALLLDGPDAIDRVVKNVTEQLAEELEKVREQDAVDSREAPVDSRSIFAEVSVCEADQQDFAEASDNLLARERAPGNIRLTTNGSPRTGIGSYRIIKERSAEPPLIPLSRLRRDFVPIEGQAGTFRREIAVATPDVRLFRYGSRFINAVSDFIMNDDRGRAFGMWRYDTDWEYEELVAFRFDFHVEANIELASGVESSADSDGSRAALRRADSLFPPAIETVWVDSAGSIITEPATLAVLNRHYRKRRVPGESDDFSLNLQRLQKAFRLVPQSSWLDQWRAAEAAAKRAITGLPRVQEKIATGMSLCSEDSNGRIQQLALREQYASAEEVAALASERTAEAYMAQTLSEAIAEPALRLDSTGIVIVAGHSIEDESE
ncbi:protein DpdE [Gordonia sp. CPCC 205515]|uniref:protein DpdE n=1 Tax=Gordonia sp. CPCC 205515 TaxID=3140791 RepID=UPI003AF37DEF